MVLLDRYMISLQKQETEAFFEVFKLFLYPILVRQMHFEYDHSSILSQCFFCFFNPYEKALGTCHVVIWNTFKVSSEFARGPRTVHLYEL